jgi:hypothetical protein
MRSLSTYRRARAAAGIPAAVPLLQPKLRVGTPGDRFEQEADDVASRVIASETGTIAGTAPIQIQRKCAACEEEEEIQRMSVGSALYLTGGEEESEQAPPVPDGEEEELHAKERPGTIPELPAGLDSRIMEMRGGGRPLDDSVRSYFEPRLGHDFSHVRIHDGAAATDAADALQARAFAVGNDLIFATGEYSPNTSSGRYLLAHELTHVVQQGAAAAHQPAMVQRLPRGGNDDPYMRNGGMLPYREATEMYECQAMLGPGSEDYCREQVLGEMTASTPQPAPPPPVTCDPNRALTWGDFAGPVPVSTFSARTAFHFDFATDNGRQIIRAFLDATSWVKPQFGDPTNRAVNGCQPHVDSCVTALTGQTGAWRSLGAAAGCAASPSPNTALRATNTGECETVLGTECDRVALLESARLLRHEQLHFSLACEMAKKGTTHLFSNPSANAQTILTAVRTRTNTLTTQYDNQSAHGCNAGPQATWETNVANGLPNVTIP